MHDQKMRELKLQDLENEGPYTDGSEIRNRDILAVAQRVGKCTFWWDSEEETGMQYVKPSATTTAQNDNNDVCELRSLSIGGFWRYALGAGP